MEELAAPLLAIQSETDPGVTSDENVTVQPETIISTSPSMRLTTPAKTRFKKVKAGKKGKNSPYQSRYYRHLA